jgi:16S rRNA G1207 methylase RsmC
MCEQLAPGFDWVVSNPPFHREQRRDLHLGKEWLEQAHRVLKPGGRMRVVVNSFLDYGRLAQGIFRSCEQIDRQNGYCIYELIK